MEVGEPRADGADRLEQVDLLDVHVEAVEAHPDIGPDGVGQRQGLLAAVDEVRLEAVQRFDRDPHAGGVGVLADLLEAGDAPLPLLLGGAVGNDLADGARHDRDLLALELLDHRDDVLHVLHGRGALLLVLGAQVALGEREGHRTPAGQAVVGEQLADVGRVVLVRLALDLDAAVAVAGQPGDGDLDRLGPHPVVHGQVHGW